MSRAARINLTVVLTIALPVFAVIASVGTAVVAFSRGDPPLPDQYHWEGDRLDHDFAQSRRAAQLHVDASLDLQAGDGVCHLTLRLDGAGLPPSVDLALIHVTNPALDRNIRFVRTSDASSYSAPCTPLPPSRWHIELSDAARSWSFRTATTGESRTIVLSASSPSDNSAWP
jgi:hypothetical protein